MSGKTITMHFVNALRTEGASLLTRHGEDAATAQRGGETFAFRVLKHIGGTMLYIKKDALNRVHRNHSVIRGNHKATTETVEELALKYDMSSRQIYSIITATRGLATSKRPTSNSGIQCIAIEAARLLLKVGISPDDAANAARGLTSVIMARFGGKAFYVPKATYLKTEQKYAEIWRQYLAGVDFEELATHFELSERQVRNIISARSRNNRPESPIADLSQLKRRVLAVSANCKGLNAEIDGLLTSAANSVEQAQEVLKAMVSDTRERL